MRNSQILWALLIFLVIGITACGQDAENNTPTVTNPAGSNTANAAIPAGPTRTPVEIPTLYPTFTPPPPPTALPTPVPAHTATPLSPADLTAPVLSFRYEIPLLGLERTVAANAGGRIVIRDEVTGREEIRTNQGPVVEEMTGALANLTLDPIPGDCPACVRFSYELPETDSSGEGWLRDPVFLASVENYTAANLGPHFPPGTVAGLRRSATPYDPAHSIAVTADGLLWRWLANADTAPSSVPVSNYPALAAAVAGLPELDLDGLQARYEAACPLSPLENMVLNPVAAGTESALPRDLTIVCPGFSLPGILVPLYVGLDGAMAEILVAGPLTPPPLELPLDMMIDYQRADGARLTIQLDGQMVGQEPLGRTFTTTLPVSTVMTLTTGMAATGRLVPGVEQYAAGELPNLLLVRGPYQMWELGWRELAPPDLRPFIAQLDQQLDQLLGLTAAPGTETETPEASTPAGSTPTTTPEP